MKKVLTLCVSILVAAAVVAQPTAKSVMLGGHVSLTNVKLEHSKESNLSYTLAPSVGFMIDDNTSLGLDLSFAKSIEEVMIDFDYYTLEYETTSIGPFVRHYSRLGSDNFYFISQGGVQIGSVKYESSPSVSITRIYFSPGFGYFFNESWSLDIMLSGINYTLVEDSYNQLEIGANFLSPALGLRFFIE